MRTVTFAHRCAKEIVRDPLTALFGLGFPLVVLFLLSAIQANIPVPLFEIEHLTPGITVFGLSFMTLFSATLVAKDRETAFLRRLYTTPLTAMDMMLGYMAPLLPTAIAQSAVCYLAAAFLGLPMTGHVVFALLMNIPMAMFYISLGLLCGSVCNVKQVGGICGALLTNVSAWLSGVWFDLELVGTTFHKIAYALPFVHAVEAERAALGGDIAAAFADTLPVLAYTAVTLTLAIVLFLRQMKRQ